jgi:parallel beta-helix repeat protein
MRGCGLARRSLGGWPLWLLLLVVPGSVDAADRCTFARAGSTWTLDADCTTDTSIVIPDGVTLDGNRHAIMAIDPENGFFRGGVIVSGGRSATVMNVTVTTVMLADVCQVGNDRLRGIYFDGAGGAIRNSTVLNVIKSGSSCQEGNGIEIRNVDTAGAMLPVDIAGNVVEGFQKTGIIASGNADVTIRGNSIGPSAAQALMVANGIQIGAGTRADIEGNTVAGNSSTGGDAAATAILLLDSAAGTTVRENLVVGNADVGIYVSASGASIERNRLIDSGPDGGYDIGIGNYGDDNAFEGNSITGYRQRFQGVTEIDAGNATIATREE